jgi:hypothetical protein
MVAASYVPSAPSRERGRKRQSQQHHQHRFSGQRKLIMTIGPAAGRHGIGLSLRQSAADPGFHGVPTGPARSARPDRDADGVGVA